MAQGLGTSMIQDRVVPEEQQPMPCCLSISDWFADLNPLDAQTATTTSVL